MPAAYADCAHCNKSGTCHTGIDASSCERCTSRIRRWTLNFASRAPAKGLVCSVCWGTGRVQPFSDKLQDRFPALFAIGLTLSLMLGSVATAAWAPTQLEKVLTFTTTLLSSITGFYFGNRTQSAAQHRTPVTRSTVKAPEQIRDGTE